jgi:PPM family protein phosphatase
MTTAMTCPHCTATLPDDDVFCEECGRRLRDELKPMAPICLCGAPEGDLDEEGYCLQCGRRCRPAPGEHEEKELSRNLAAVSDRGMRHHRNEDHFEISSDGAREVIVVCDGVSTSARADDAAAAASECIARGLIAGGDMASAFKEATDVVVALANQSPADVAPSTCAVAARVENGRAEIGWLGDSRVYWISKNDSRQLTTDHSWLNEVVTSGEMSCAEAEESPCAHGVTRWIGADAGPDSVADETTFEIPGPGWLVLCSDGLWNYAPEIEELAKLVLRFADDAAALEIARYLVSFANEKGGHDNVTAALLRVGS